MYLYYLPKKKYNCLVFQFLYQSRGLPKKIKIKKEKLISFQGSAMILLFGVQDNYYTIWLISSIVNALCLLCSVLNSEKS